MKTVKDPSVCADELIHSPNLSHDIWRRRSHPLDAIFRPRSVAIVGATEKHGSVGLALLQNMSRGPFKGEVYPVNPKYAELMGLKAYPSIAACPAPVDLAVIATPAPTVAGLMEECGLAGVRGAVVISAGFKELGPEGERYEKETIRIARKYGIRVIGPNCLGVMNTRGGLNVTFASKMARKGNVGFISQSGALCTAVLDWSLTEDVGFSSFISAGSMADVGWGDLIDYLGDDPDTESILIYMESIGDARSFLSSAREVALTKPIIVLKAGRTEEAAKAAVSHTGSIAGSDAVLDAAFRRCGIVRVNEIRDLFSLAEILSKQPRPKGPHLAILTNAGGPGVLATDALVESGGALAKLSEDTYRRINSILPAHWSRNNPVDVLGDADASRYAKTLDVLLADEGVDGALVILTPQAMTEPTKTAEVLREYAQKSRKPVLASWMGAGDVEEGRRLLTKSRIPNFPFPDEAARLFQSTWRYSRNLKALYETPVSSGFSSKDPFPAPETARALIETIRASGRSLLTEEESKQVLASYGIPTVRTEIAATAAEAEKAADAIGYPVVLKLHSRTITHKSDVGGVRLNLQNGREAREAFEDIRRSVERKTGGGFDGVTVQPMIRGGYEIILGATPDAQLGPVILFGAGGKLVEIFKDHAVGLPPLNTNLAVRMMEETRIYQALKGVRGEKTADLSQLSDILVRFSRLVAEQRWIREIDVNPLLVSSERIVALDARVVLYEKGFSETALPKLAIRPYPVDYVTVSKISSGEEVTIRPIRPEDEPLMVEFHHSLSAQSIRGRYFREMGLSERIAHERLTRVCFNDYDREIALVAEAPDGRGLPRIRAVARLSRERGTGEALFAMIIADPFQRKGLGKNLLELLLEVARKENIRRVWAYVEPENRAMRSLCRTLGFSVGPAPEKPGFLLAEIFLKT
ncbi:MAG TPA: GNAT family N-acetyltransferase [Candidatus Eisenbacteria bacterium]|nr:GNAT family N-acetyltransferase [Candidatus Eisenbacteria bacterium]